MTAIQESRAGRKRRVVAGSLFILLLALLGGAAYLDVWPAQGEANSSPTVWIDVEHGGQCHLIPSSCSSPPPVTNVWSVGDGSVFIHQDMPLRAADPHDSDVLSEALVLLPTPPPRSA